MEKITTKTRLLILFLSLGGVSYAQVQNENTYTFPHFNDVGVGTTVTTNFQGNINYKLTAASKLYQHTFFNPILEEDIEIAPTIPFRILAEWDPGNSNYTNFLFEARVYPNPDPFASNQRVFSMQKDGALLLGSSSNSTTSYGFSYGLISDRSIYSKDKIFAESRIGIGTTNPATSLDITNGDIALNDNRIRLKSATDGNNYLQYKQTYKGNSVDGPVLSGSQGGVLASASGGGRNILQWTNAAVGIRTNNPVTELEVKGKVRFSANAYSNDEIQFEPQPGHHRILYHSLRFHEWGANGDVLTLNNGNVGIGTTTPTSILDIDGGNVALNDNQLRFRSAGDGNNFLQIKENYQNQLLNGPILAGYAGGALVTTVNSEKSILTWKHNGKVGINTNNPSAALEVVGMVKFDGANANDELISKSFPGYRTLEFHQLRLAEWGYGSVLTISDGKVGIWNTSPATALDVTGAIQSSAAPTTDAIRVENSNSSAIDFKVKGNGYVYAREIEITMNPFPDYVFDKEYNLMSLHKLSQFISENNHLPGVKSADEVKKEGIGLGELSKVQMEKIEELTLYILQLESRIKKLEAKVKE